MADHLPKWKYSHGLPTCMAILLDGIWNVFCGRCLAYFNAQLFGFSNMVRATFCVHVGMALDDASPDAAYDWRVG